MRELFDQVVARPVEVARAHLAEHCDDPIVRAAVLELLPFATQQGDSPTPDGAYGADGAPEIATAAAASDLTGKQLGAFRIGRHIGAGGMGLVYEAEQTSPKRTVALKLIRPQAFGSDHDRERARRRFEVERDSLARLQHPSIAQIYEAGEDDFGQGAQPWFAMELVAGTTLLQYAEGHRTGGRTAERLSNRERLELVARIAEATQHAHQRGVIHRDLKPSNILVNDEGEPKVLDFGVARLVDRDSASTQQTDPGQIVGTLAYMSPEQARGDTDAIDTRSDVYSLGVVAFELLSGRLPLDVRGKHPAEAARMLAEDEATSIGTIDRSLRGDVESILGKALEKVPARRYGSAGDLTTDIRRFLAGEPVLAHSGTAFYAFRKFVRRHRWGTTVAATVLLAVLAVVVVRVVHLEQEQRSKAIADFSSNVLRQTLKAADRRFRSTNAPITASELLQPAIDAIERQRGTVPPLAEADLRMLVGNTLHSLWQLDASRLQLAEALRLRRLELPGDHRDVATSLNDLAQVINDQGDYAAAEPLMREALHALRQSVGFEDKITITCCSNLAQLLVEMGRTKEAEQLYAEAVAASERSGNQAAGLVHNRSLLLEAQGRYEEAEELAIRGLELARQERDEGHPDVLRARGNVACLRSRRGDHEGAERELLALLEDCKRSLGDEHADTLTVMHNLAATWESMERFSEAITMLERTVAIGQSVLGPDHPELAATIRTLANIYVQHSRFREAENLLSAALKNCTDHLGGTHRRTLMILNDLGAVYTDMANYELAETTYKKAIEGYRQVGADHPDALDAENNLAVLYLKQGKRENALDILDKLVPRQEAACGRDSQKALVAKCNLAGALERKDPRRAEVLYREVLEVRRRILTADHLEVAVTLNNLANLIQDPERLEEKESLHREALRIRLLKLGPDSVLVAQSQTNLANVLYQRQLCEEAEELYWPALATRRRLLGDHPDVLHSMYGMCKVLVARQAFGEATDLSRDGVALVGRLIAANRLRPTAGMSWTELLCDVLLKGGSEEGPAETERLARAALAEPPAVLDGWLRLALQSQLGGALLARAATPSLPTEARAALLAEAEQALLPACERMEPPRLNPLPKKEAFDRLVAVYAAWHTLDPAGDHEAKAAVWRTRAAEWLSKRSDK